VEALGRSRGGFSTKLHAAVDALGNPLGFVLTPGQRADITQAEHLIEPHQVEAVIADKGYDSAALVAYVEAREAEAVIPSRRNRKEQREIDRNLYKDRNKVERFFNRLKHYRRVATRYEKTARNYLSMVYLASTMIWLL
jgi:transposase